MRSHRSRAGLLGALAVVAWASLANGRAMQQPGDADSRAAEVRQAIAVGSYAEAERLASSWLDRVEAKQGDGSEIARPLNWLVEARLRNGKAGAPLTVTLAGRAVDLTRREFGPTHVETARALHNLGATRAQRGEFAAALRVHEDVLSMRTAALGPNDPSVADSLDQIAFTLIQLERFQEAARRLTESQRIREHWSGEAPLALAVTLELVGLLHRSSGDYLAAMPPLDRALEIRQRLAPAHPDGASALQTRGDVLLLRGDLAGARRAWASALELSERTLGQDHPVVVEALRRLGFAAFSLGNLAEARRLRTRALQIGLPLLAPCDPAVVRLLNIVAISSGSEGEYAEAQKLYQRALDTLDGCVASGSSEEASDTYATTVYNSADLARDIGDFAEAERLYRRAVEIWTKGLGRNHPFVARGLDALADVAASRGELTKALALYEQALARRRVSLGADHPQVAWTQINLARTIAGMGRLTRARGYIDEALEIYRRSGATDEPDHLARALDLRGVVESRLGNLEAARANLTEALAERERIFGASHPAVAETRSSLARVDFARGDAEAALTAALRAERAGLAHLRSTVRYLPERQAMTYASRRPRGLDLALSVAAAAEHTDLAAVFDLVIQQRGVVLDELASRNRTTSDSSVDVAPLVARAGAARQRLANLVVRSFEEPVTRALLDEAGREKDEAERALAQRSAEARGELARASAGLDAIRQALPPRSALVSFVRYDRVFVPGAATRPRVQTPVPAYAAFLVDAESSGARFVPLGAAATLDDLVRRWRHEAAGGALMAGLPSDVAERSYVTAALRLRQASWDPLARHLEGRTKVFIVPDGLLNLVSFAALPMGSGGYLAEGPQVIHYLSTERDLVAAETNRVPSEKLIAVGGPAFDSVPLTRGATPAPRRSGCTPVNGRRFEHLPGSLREVQEIRRLWSAAADNGVTVLSGAQATEASVKRGLAGHRVIHLATHGFFLGGDCVPAPASARSVGGLAPSARLAPAAMENPLLLTGLALAGANRRGPASVQEDEGLLTAEEVSGLDLQGTEWAVLSACDTGLGAIRAGEGVFGLRRAFQVAGVRTVIMSLWPVEDEATRLWMRALYEGRLTRHLDTADAVREAALSVLRARRAQGQSSHPFYWAAFVAAGDWR